VIRFDAEERVSVLRIKYNRAEKMWREFTVPQARIRFGADVFPQLLPLVFQRPDIGALVKRHAIRAAVWEELFFGNRV
jgi:hypothetical protein